MIQNDYHICVATLLLHFSQQLFEFHHQPAAHHHTDRHSLTSVLWLAVVVLLEKKARQGRYMNDEDGVYVVVAI
jgi:hypothetical protein